MQVTPLYLAAQEGRLRCVKALLKHGADPSRRVKEGTTGENHSAADVAWQCLRLRCWLAIKTTSPQRQPVAAASS